MREERAETTRRHPKTIEFFEASNKYQASCAEWVHKNLFDDLCEKMEEIDARRTNQEHDTEFCNTGLMQKVHELRTKADTLMARAESMGECEGCQNCSGKRPRV